MKENDWERLEEAVLLRFYGILHRPIARMVRQKGTVYIWRGKCGGEEKISQVTVIVMSYL